MLETAFTASIEAIALSSDEGISLSELFAQVSSQHGTLTSVARTLLWRQLVAHPDINIVENDMDEEEVRSFTVETAQQVGIRISASRDLQDAALGVYAARLQRFALSDTQRSTLRLLATSKERGMFQSQLTSMLGVDPRNYSYVVKNLEERGLVVKCQALIKAAPESTPHDKKPPPPAATNLVVLSRFASRGIFADLSVGLSTARVMNEEHGQGNDNDNDNGDDNENDNDNDDGDNEGEDGLDSHIISTDDVHIRSIISKLSSLENFTAKESHLKQVLGFVRKQGHRLWRRLRGLLIKRGTIETFVGVDKETGKTSVFVKLLKPPTEGQNSVEEEENEEDTVTKALGNLLDERTGKLNIYGQQVAELSLDRQLLRLLAEAGSTGLTTAAIDTALRLNMKRNEPRIREMKAACGPGGVTEIHVTAGRSRMLRFTAAPHVLDAIYRAGPNEMVAEDKGSGAAAKKAEQNIKRTNTTSAIETPQISMHGGQAPESQISKKDLQNKKQPAKTELGVMRRNWLVQYVLSEGIVLTYEVGRYLQLQQAERDAKGYYHNQGGADAVRPDRKVIQRIISSAVEDGELCIIHVTLPGVHGLKGSRAQGVLARPGTVQDAAFMDAVYQRHKEAQKLQRTDTRLKSVVTSAVTSVEGGASEDLQIVAVQSLRQEAAEAVARRRQLYQDRFADEVPEDLGVSLPAVQIDARFLPARMLRVEGIFEMAWELVTTRESKSPIAPFLDSAAAQGNAYILRGGPFQGSEEQHARVFTGQELWKFLTVDKFFECLGTRASPSDVHAALSSYNVGNGSPIRLGSMAPKDLLQIAGGRYAIDRAKIALTRTMDLLHRMGLLSPITILGQSSSSVDDEDAVYLLSNTMRYDTVPNEPEQTRTFVAADGDARLQYWHSMMHLVLTCHDSQSLSQCFPFSRAPEIVQDRAWMLCKVSDLVDEIALVFNLLREEDSSRSIESGAADVSWQRTLSIVEEHSVSFEGAVRGVMRYLSYVSNKGKVGGGGGKRGGRLGGLGGLSSSRGSRRRAGQKRKRSKLVRKIKRGEAGLLLDHDAFGSDREYEDDEGSFGSDHGDDEDLGLELELDSFNADEYGEGDGDGDEEEGRVAIEEEEEEEEEEAEAEAEVEAEEDAVAEKPYPTPSFHPLPSRKKLWRELEDRALLLGWARWVVTYGPDIPVKWDRLDPLPPNVRPISCRNRIQTLQTHAATTDGVCRIHQLAVSMYSRRVSEDRANGNENEEDIGLMKASTERPAKRQRLLLGKEEYTFEASSEDAKSCLVQEIDAVLCVCPNRKSTSNSMNAEVLLRRRQLRIRNELISYAQNWSPRSKLKVLHLLQRRNLNLNLGRSSPNAQASNALIAVLYRAYMGQRGTVHTDIAALKLQFPKHAIMHAGRRLVNDDMVMLVDGVPHLSDSFFSVLRPLFLSDQAFTNDGCGVVDLLWGVVNGKKEIRVTMDRVARAHYPITTRAQSRGEPETASNLLRILHSIHITIKDAPNGADQGKECRDLLRGRHPPVGVHAPWMSPDGSCVRELWVALLRRAVSVVMAGPGISLSTAVQALADLAAEAEVHAVFSALEAAGIVRVRKVDVHRQRKRSLWNACFARVAPSSDAKTSVGGGDLQDEQLHLFLNPSVPWWDLDGVIPSLV